MSIEPVSSIIVKCLKRALNSKGTPDGWMGLGEKEEVKRQERLEIGRVLLHGLLFWVKLKRDKGARKASAGAYHKYSKYFSWGSL